MSYRRLSVEITGNSRGLEAALNRINAGLGQTQSRVRAANTEMSLMQKQLLAIGTTARYALAGMFVFGVTSAISRLTDFANQLGQVAALAGTLNRQTGHYTGPSQGILAGIGDMAILESNKLGIATNDIQSYMTRFFSSFQPPPGKSKSELKGFVDEVARLQAMLGAEAGDPQQLAGGIAGMVNQIPGGRRNIAGTTNRVANLISFMLAETPNVTGRDIARDIGRVGATMTQANMSPEQAFAVWGLAGKAGGSSSVIGRGIAQLLGTSLLHPTTPGQQRAYASIGLPSDPNMLAKMGGMQVLLRMMNRVGTGVKIKNKGALGNENIDDETALQAAGVTGANRTLLYSLFGRQESVRQFINLIGQGGTKALRDYIQVQNRATKANAAREREDAANRQRALARFTTARQNIGLGLARGIEWPLENVVAPAVGGVSNVITKHKTATDIALSALFGAFALKRGASLLRSFKRGGASPGTELASTLLATEAMPNVLAGGTTDGTRANPYWVIIHPDSWYVGSPGGNTGLYGPNSPPGGGGAKWLKRIPPIIPVGGIASAAAASAVAAPFVLAGVDFYNSRVGHGGARSVSMQQRMSPSQSLSKLLMDKGGLSWAMTKDIEQGYHRRGLGDPVIVRMQADDVHQQFTIKLVDAQGRTIKIEDKKGVPMKFSAVTSPTYKGKNKSKRGAP